MFKASPAKKFGWEDELRRIREGRLGDRTLRLVEKGKLFVGIIISDGAIKAQIDGNNADDVWRRLHDEAAKANPRYFGFDGARARFLHFFPNGFHSDGYADQERNYKVAAKARLDDAVPLESGATGSGFGEAILSVYRDTNLLSPFEKVRLQDVLRGPAGDPFITAARFTMGDNSALAEMEHGLRPHESAKWTVVTYLPFLWRPEKHMFLKPELDFGQFTQCPEARILKGKWIQRGILSRSRLGRDRKEIDAPLILRFERSLTH